MNRPHFTNPVQTIERRDCQTLIELAISEDAPSGDVTSESIFSNNEKGKASLVSRESGVLCGIPLVEILLKIFQEKTGYALEMKSDLKDGQSFKKGDGILQITGSIAGILRIERIALNFIQYLSGIATTTAKAVYAAPADVYVLDTRKTLPGYRRLAKYAVFTGGGTNHRIHLSEMAMIKDNHVAAAGGITQAATLVRKKFPEIPMELEIDSMMQLPEALAQKPKVLLLDNMTADQIKQAALQIKEITKTNHIPIPVIEVSGGWKPDMLKDLANTGLPLGVSMGFLTHTTRFLDLSLEIEKG